jgi:hypothetical protein
LFVSFEAPETVPGTRIVDPAHQATLGSLELITGTVCPRFAAAAYMRDRGGTESQ